MGFTKDWAFVFFMFGLSFISTGVVFSTALNPIFGVTMMVMGLMWFVVGAVSLHKRK